MTVMNNGSNAVSLHRPARSGLAPGSAYLFWRTGEALLRIAHPGRLAPPVACLMRYRR